MLEFENGTLLKQAYIEIDGVQHEVHPAEYKTEKPISAENLNKMQKTQEITEKNPDLNNFFKDGKYYFDSEIQPINTPEEGVSGWLEVFTTDTIFTKQIWYSELGEVYTRINVKESWNDWKRISITDEEWHDLQPMNGCTTYDSEDPYPKLQYKKIGNEVILRGMFSKVTNGAGTIAQLPVGYRPNKTIYFAAAGGDSFAAVFIDSDGNIKSTLTNNGWLSLEGIRFFID